MKLPPAWKVRRELWRLREKLFGLALSPAVDRIIQASYDRRYTVRVRETSGSLPLTSRVAVFVLFQPKGVAASTFFTLDHLAKEGWSVLIISNAPLSDTDRTRLAARVGLILERPNVGYDFGAYRDGWRWLKSHSHDTERLILMNDSSWFPLRMQDDSLLRMEALDADLAGHILKTERANDPQHDHVESHLLMLGPRALRHSAINNFWDKYLMSSNKARTISNGEKGLTQAARMAGLKVRGLLERQDILSFLQQLSLQDLRRAVANLALHNVEAKDWRNGLISSEMEEEPYRKAVLNWVDDALANSRSILLSAAFAELAIGQLGMGFLKKSSDLRFQLARMAVLRGLANQTIPSLDPSVQQEVERTVQNWKKPFDWREKPGSGLELEL